MHDDIEGKKVPSMDFRELNRRKNYALRRFKTYLAKLFLDRRSPARFTPSKLKEIRRIALLRNDDKIGDMIVATMLLRELKKQLPLARIMVLAGPRAAEVISNNRNVGDIVICVKNFRRILKAGIALRRQNFDLFIDMDERPLWHTLLLLRLMNPKYIFGFNRGGYGLYNINAVCDFNGGHITALHRKMFEILRLQKPADGYDIFVPKALRERAKKFFEALPRAAGNIIFNPFAASKHRALSYAQAEETARALPSYNFVLTGAPRELAAFTAGRVLPPNLHAAPAREEGLFWSFALLAASDAVITPDTAIVHAAVAFDRPLLALYRGGGNGTMPLWGPGLNARRARIITAPAGADLSRVPAADIAKELAALLRG
ncbi:MAG: hypothetical protein LBL61_05110 [Elusimicrobiota bacterium]|jgi:ADP-heptose:LPS heptosyltransferase|nr:hypothetical protein [Elusimicrobiota bacterium]